VGSSKLGLNTFHVLRILFSSTMRLNLGFFLSPSFSRLFASFLFQVFRNLFVQRPSSWVHLFSRWLGNSLLFDILFSRWLGGGVLFDILFSKVIFFLFIGLLNETLILCDFCCWVIPVISPVVTLVWAKANFLHTLLRQYIFVFHVWVSLWVCI